MEVIFFPRNDYPSNVSVCAHRLGKKMTYTDQTDGLNFSISYFQYMALAKARNIKVGAFTSYYEMDNVNLPSAIADYNNNKLWIDEYSLCPSLYDKITHYQSPTEEEFIYAYNNELLPSFLRAFGRKPVALSYSYGQEGFKNSVCPRYLGARNSGYVGYTDYGIGYGSPNDIAYSFNNFKSRQGTTRWYDQAKINDNKFQEQLDIQSAKIDETLLNGGWLNNFTHWHNYWQDGNEEWAEAYLDLLASKNANNEIYFSGYGEAVAYLVYRQIITRVAMYSPTADASTKLVIRLETENTLGVDTDLLQVPISVKFSTSGTPLANQLIKCNCRNLLSLGNNEYIVEIPFDRFPHAVIEKLNP